MQPLTELFRSTIETFPSILLEHRVKLADITSEKEVLGLTDDEILKSDDIFPKRYELETLRYWRKMGLLPFFDQSKHAYISISQLMWLRFLSELKNLGASIAMLKEANYYFIERGYRDEVARLNLLELKRKLIEELAKDPNNAINIQSLKNVEHILNDRLLKYSIQIDFNYFNLNIIDHLINGTHVQFAVTAERILNKESNELEKKQAFSVIRNHKNDEKLNTVLDKEKNDFYNYEKKALKKPAILFPAELFLEDVFGDCSISEKAFNIMILTKTEKDLFVQIRNRNVKEVELLSESDNENKKLYSMLDTNGEHNKDSIKKIKVLMGTKAYEKGIATLKNGTKLKFSSNVYAEENS
jgi:DNA-binding transcriptional MerR regulator